MSWFNRQNHPTPGAIKGVFAHLDCLVEGIDQLKQAGLDDFIVTSPLPRHEIEEQIYCGKPSPVRWFTLCVALSSAGPRGSPSHPSPTSTGR